MVWITAPVSTAVITLVLYLCISMVAIAANPAYETIAVTRVKEQCTTGPTTADDLWLYNVTMSKIVQSCSCGTVYCGHTI